MGSQAVIDSRVNANNRASDVAKVGWVKEVFHFLEEKQVARVGRCSISLLNAILENREDPRACDAFRHVQRLPRCGFDDEIPYVGYLCYDRPLDKVDCEEIREWFRAAVTHGHRWNSYRFLSVLAGLASIPWTTTRECYEIGIDVCASRGDVKMTGFFVDIARNPRERKIFACQKHWDDDCACLFCQKSLAATCDDRLRKRGGLNTYYDRTDNARIEEEEFFFGIHTEDAGSYENRMQTKCATLNAVIDLRSA